MVGRLSTSSRVNVPDLTEMGLLLAGVIVIVGIINYWLLLPTAVAFVLFYTLRVIYIRTSRSVKRLEGITRSPVFSHLGASLRGLTTIRAFGAQEILEKEFDCHQDLHSSAWFLFIASSRTFGFWLDIVCLIYISIVTLSFLVFDNSEFVNNQRSRSLGTSFSIQIHQDFTPLLFYFVGFCFSPVAFGGNVGLAITQCIGLTGMFQWGMRQSAEVENQMTSVERVLEYTKVEHEPAFDSTEGGTGAGKSSMIAAMFRLAELDGQIVIDGIDTCSIGLHDLRLKLSIIPQEPVLFSGTMRGNLDPFNNFQDGVLWQALEEVEMKDVVKNLVGGLNSKMCEGGSNFSVGQRQLVCLARAIVRNNKILVLDEATANVDPQTDNLIQSTIRRNFSNCTVLTIAHRLNTVMDSDRVMVMDAGTMVEFDHPFLLLKNKNGFLFRMVQQTGSSMRSLLRTAEQGEVLYVMRLTPSYPSFPYASALWFWSNVLLLAGAVSWERDCRTLHLDLYLRSGSGYLYQR
uniref:Uncharacterized protein n=1 Tax=Timema genevievae TaxID=629358 RepID=A0A7R9K0F8_TIMGE|nr:unnamed protein product [Timema genevievae]